jgi:hypothetical protein
MSVSCFFVFFVIVYSVVITRYVLIAFNTDI